MANSKIKGITIELGGDTTKLDKALSDSEKQSKNLQSELKGINTLLKFDPSSIELITQKQQVLSETIEATKGKLKTLEQAQVQVQQQFEKGEITAEQYRSFQREIVSTQKKLSDLENQQSQLNSVLNQAESAYSSLTNKISSQEDELSSLKKEYTNIVLEYGDTSDEAQNLAKKLTDLSGELNDNKAKLNNAERAAEELSQSLKEANDSAKNTDGYTVAKDVLSDFASNAIQGVIDGIGNIISSLGELPEATKEYRTMMAKLEGSTKTFGYSADFSKEQFDKFYSYLGDNQMATNAITNLMGIGTSTESISKVAEGAIGVWATYGDSIPIESLTEAINETITVGKVTGTMADTINWAKVSQDELKTALSGNSKAQKAFNQAIKEGETAEDAFNAALATTTSAQERADIVAQFLNATYGASKTTYDEMTGSIQEATTAENNLQSKQAELAEAVEPMQTAFTNLKTQALDLLLPIVEKISQLFQDLGKWMEENPAKAEILKASIIGIATALGILAGALAISNLISLVQKAFSLLNLTMLANPIVLIVAAIAGLVVAFLTLWKNCESFRDFWIGLWDKIKEGFNNAIEGIKLGIEAVKEFFNDLGTKISEKWENLKSVLSTIGEWINTNVIQPVIGFFQSLWSGIQAVWDGIVLGIQIFIGLVASIFHAAFQIITLPFMFIWENCKEYIFDFIEIAKQFISDVVDWIVDKFNWLKEQVILVWGLIKEYIIQPIVEMYNKIIEIIQIVVDWIIDRFNDLKAKIHETFQLIKTYIIQPIIDAYNSVVKWVKDLVSKITEKFNELKQKVTDIFNKIKDDITEKISDVKSKVAEIVGNIKDKVVNTFNTLKENVTNTFNKIKDAISKPIEKARDIIKNVVDKIKEFFKFKVELPKIKLPHFSIKPKGWKIGDLMEGSIPKLGIEWYAKGAILKKPTIFGTNGNNVMVGGEAGTEAIAPISELLKYVKIGVDESLREALFDALTSFTNTRVQTRNTTIYGINELTGLLKVYMPEIIDNMGRDVIMDGKKVGQIIAPEINKQLGYIAEANARGR